MRYVILGAGAVGGAIGGRLADAGHEVLLLARGAHAAAIRSDGLRLALPDRVLRLVLPVVSTPAELELRPDDVLLLTVKSQQTVPLLDAVSLLPVAGGTAGEVLPVLLAQNGVSNERAALRRFRQVYGVCVMLPATHLEPGRVAAQGGPMTGILELGAYPAAPASPLLADVCTDLNDSGFLATPRDDVMPWKYRKLLANLGNSLDALVGEERSAPAAVTLVERAVAEAEACFAAAGIPVVTDEEWWAHRTGKLEFRAVEGEARTGSSTWQSAARGTGSLEVDHLNGEIVLLGRLHGVPTPVNELLQRAAAQLAMRRDRPGSVRLSSLL